MHQANQELYEGYHALLFPIAMNLLRDNKDADDMVQETMLKWLSIDREKIENPRGYLVKTLINTCLNHIRAQKRRGRTPEVEIDPSLLVDHLPEMIEKGPALSLTFLMILEKLNAVERAVFLLKEVFGYTHREIAEILDLSEENSRQILSRARRHLKSANSRYEADPEQHRVLYEVFVEVCSGEEDLHQLIDLLREDIVVQAPGISSGIQNRMEAAVYLRQQFGNITHYEWIRVRGVPVLLLYVFGKMIGYLQLRLSGNRISRIDIRIPDTHIRPVLPVSPAPSALPFSC